MSKTKTYPNDFRWLAKQRECQKAKTDQRRKERGRKLRHPKCKSCQKRFRTYHSKRIFCNRRCKEQFAARHRSRSYGADTARYRAKQKRRRVIQFLSATQNLTSKTK
jgi:hypothetical protein